VIGADLDLPKLLPAHHRRSRSRRACSRSTTPSRAVRRVSSSFASCATTSHRPAFVASPSAFANASSTASGCPSEAGPAPSEPGPTVSIGVDRSSAFPVISTGWPLSLPLSRNLNPVRLPVPPLVRDISAFLGAGRGSVNCYRAVRRIRASAALPCRSAAAAAGSCPRITSHRAGRAVAQSRKSRAFTHHRNV
jgi:hypothetical protein